MGLNDMHLGEKAATRACWVDTDGNVIACVEKRRVLEENDRELRLALQEAFEDGVLMGVTPAAMLETFSAMLRDLKSPFRGATVSEDHV